MIHCTPVEESERSSWMVGMAIATIVWSMKVIETAKIIAARISLLFLPLVRLHACGFDAAAAFPAAGSVRYSRRRHASRLLDRARNRRLRLPRRRHLRCPLAHRHLGTGAAMGAYLGVMIAFPLLAIGLASS